MRIALAQQNYRIGDIAGNTAKILAAIQQAKAAGAELILFSELAVCGYPPRDLLEFPEFIHACDDSLDQIRQSAHGIGILIGAPQRNPNKHGKRLFNAAYLFDDQALVGVAQKTCLPTYDIFDEYRYFEPARNWSVLNFRGKKLAITICEDIWNLGDHPLYPTCPLDQLLPQQPDLILNLSASPFDYTHLEDRKAILKQNIRKYKCPMLYCNAVGSQTEIVFDGGSLVMDAEANLIQQLPLFEECVAYVDWNENGSFDRPIQAVAAELPEAEYNPDSLQAQEGIREIHQALVMGIRDYFGKMGFRQAILGSSGGIDSAVTLALAVEALGKENVRALLLPSPFSSSHSVTDAKLLSERLGNPYDVLPIDRVFDAFLTELKPVFADRPFGLAEENMQSRIRGNFLMSVANKFGYILLNTSNKSELATGYGTLYGDMAGGLAVLGDCYKLQVYALARYINRDKEVIPFSILDKAPSAELRPNQKDSDSLPDYSLLDPILYQYIELRNGPESIISQGFDRDTVARVIRLVNINEYKRNQFCPIIRISPKSFGMGRRMPIVAHYLTEKPNS
ncbi:MAG: NAD+ synthase [Bacteroidetes bacterium]|nr:NAD+ synthase [Bacteroidota bacterium]